MPEIKRQQGGPAKGVPPNGQSQVAPAPGVSAWDLATGLRVLLYGQSGTGKTTFWATFPSPILTLVCSGGNRPGELLSVDTPKNRERITPVVVRSTGEISSYIGAARNFRTVVLDHASGLQDLALREVLGVDELPSQRSWGMAKQQDWGQCSRMCSDIFRALLNLPCNVVIVAQERTFGVEEGTQEVITPTVGPALTPSLAGWLAPACDFVLQCFKRPKMRTERTEVGKQVVETQVRARGVDYCLRTGAHDVFMSKIRTPRGVVVPEVIVDPTYDKLVRVTRGEKV